jgi:hypothetical protein
LTLRVHGLVFSALLAFNRRPANRQGRECSRHVSWNGLARSFRGLGLPRSCTVVVASHVTRTKRHNATVSKAPGDAMQTSSMGIGAEKSD